LLYYHSEKIFKNFAFRLSLFKFTFAISPSAFRFLKSVSAHPCVRWTDFIDTLGGEALEHEERVYQEFLPRAAGDNHEYNHFMDLAERARG